MFLEDGRDAKLDASVLLGSWVALLCLPCVVGGPALLAACTRGELTSLDLASVPESAWLALAYLVGVGTILAGGANTWLLRNPPVGLVAPYAFVHPVVAVGLGVWLRQEALSSRVAVGAAVLLGGVALVVMGSLRRREHAGVETVVRLDEPCREVAAS